MANFYDKASLVLIPSGTKEGVVFSQKPTNGDGDFTFSRASSATRVNSDGLIEKETQNLILQSNSFDTTWISNNTTETSGQSGYDGSSDAWLISKSASGGRIYQTISSSGVQTSSVYAKANTANWIILEMAGIGYTSFDLVNGSSGNNIGGIIDSDIVSIGNGWYRVSILFNGATYGFRVYPAEGDNVTSATSGSIYIQDAQLNQGLVADSYLETTTSAVYVGITDNIPRLDYNGSCPSLLLEPQRTNIVFNSEYFGASSWVKQNCTITSNYAISPEGVNNASRIVSSGAFYLYQLFIFTNAVEYTLSFYVKSNGSGNDSFRLYAEGNSTTKTATNEWVRHEYTFTGQGTSKDFGLRDIGGLSLDILIWGAMVEQSSYATSYIPTYGASVTFASDACNSAGNASTFNDSEGVLYAEVAALYDDGTNRVMTISDGTLNNRIAIAYTPTGNQVRGYLQGSSTITLDYIVSNILEFNKIAVKYKSNDISLWVNGVEVGTSTSAFSVSGLSELAFDRGDGNLPLYSKTKQILYFPTALTDEELEALTQV